MMLGLHDTHIPTDIRFGSVRFHLPRLNENVFNRLPKSLSNPFTHQIYYCRRRNCNRHNHDASLHARIGVVFASLLPSYKIWIIIRMVLIDNDSNGYKVNEVDSFVWMQHNGATQWARVEVIQSGRFNFSSGSFLFFHFVWWFWSIAIDNHAVNISIVVKLHHCSLTEE